jgi:hypothetical protein
LPRANRRLNHKGRTLPRGREASEGKG